MFGSGQTFAGGEVEGGGEPLTYGPFLTPRRVKCQFSFRCFVRKSCRQLEGASMQPLREKCSLPSSICDAGSAGCGGWEILVRICDIRHTCGQIFLKLLKNLPLSRQDIIASVSIALGSTRSDAVTFFAFLQRIYWVGRKSGP